MYGWSGSRTRRCLWTLEEVGADFMFEFLDKAAGEHRSPEYLRINPNGRVPTLVDGSTVLFESAAICSYVARKYPEHGLIPEAKSPDYAQYEQWMFWTVAELEQPLWSIGKHRFALPPEYRVAEMERVAAHEWEQASAVVRDRLDGMFMVAGRFTVVDILLTHTLLWADHFGLPMDAALSRYRDVHMQREAFQRTFAYP